MTAADVDEPIAEVGSGRGDDESGTSGAPVGKLASQVALKIEAEILRRGWPVGESLGSEVDLRVRHGVSRSVLREAVRLVEHHQVARMRRGPHGGLFVAAPDAVPANRAMVIYLEYIGTSIDDLLAARKLLEPLAASLAAERITEPGIAALRAMMEDDQSQPNELQEWSVDALHVKLGELSGNPVLQLFIDVLARLTVRFGQTSRRTPRAELLSARENVRRRHAEIVDAVIAGDTGHAQTRMLTYLGEVQEWLEEHAVRGSGPRPVPVREMSTGGHQMKMAEVVAERIRDDIAAAGWQIGAVLGSEAELLARYRVSRAVLREAVRLLEYHAVARMRRGPGGGLIVTSPEPQASVDTMALYLEFQRVTGEDLRLVRDVIELDTVARATERRADPDVPQRLERAAAYASEGPTGERARADLFHTELADIAGNPVMALFLRIITELFRRHTTTQADPAPGDEAAAEVDRIHGHILRAILDGDEGIARHRMRRHLEALTPWWH